jgi:hypothetical protein
MYVHGLKAQSEIPGSYWDFTGKYGITSELQLDNLKSEISQRVKVIN